MNPGTALITGASSGIGLELARLFARDHWNLVLTARNESALNRLAEDLRTKHAINVIVLPADLSKPEVPLKIFNSLQEQHFEIDALVNNAGFGTHGLFAEIDSASELDELQVNIAALTHFTKLFLPAMLQRKKGMVLNVASSAGFQPGPFMAVYYASKAYVLHFSEAIANELRGTGVTVTCLCPGPTLTEFQKRAGVGATYLFRNFAVLDAPAVALAGYRGMLKGKTLVIPGFPMKLTAFSIRFAPRKMAANLVRWLHKERGS